MGRRIFDNIRKAMEYVFAVHFPIAGLTLLALILKWPLILFPAHIVFLELIIDPTSSIVFEAVKEEDYIMKRKPRPPKEKIFNQKTIFLSVCQGLFILALVAIIFKYSMYLGKTESVSRALAFSTLIVSNLILILTNISWKHSIVSLNNFKNKALIYVVSGAAIFLVLTIYVPYLSQIFLFEPLGLREWAIVLATGVFTGFCFEVFERMVKEN
jgi:Ca2+-transporting ATPase